MRVKCVTNECYFRFSTDVNKGNKRKESTQEIVVGKEYTVYGMVMFDFSLYYLIVSSINRPSFLRADYFQIEDSSLSEDWVFAYKGQEKLSVQAIWGYRLLVESESHYNGLIERERSELDYFFDNVCDNRF